MAIANINIADFLKEGTNVTFSTSDEGRIITVNANNGASPVTGNGFTSYAYAVWSGSGLIFNVFYSSYYIQNVLYPAGSDNITLDASDVTNDRFDTIAVDATGAIKITGTAAADPIIPTIDNLTQIAITSIFVEANATTPVLISDENIYLENTEWTGSSDVAGADFASTTDPFAGTKDVEIGSFTAGKYVRFVDGSTHQISDYNYLKFYVKLRATFASTAGFIISFRNGTSVISSAFTITNGIYSFDRTDTSGYQLIVIPLSEFTFTGSTFDTLNIELKGSNGTGFRLDNIVLQGGISGASVEQNALVTISTPSGSAVATQANDTFVFAEGANMTITASGKTITFAASGGGGTPGGADTNVQYNDGGSFGGEAAFTYNKTTNTLTVDAVVVNAETASRVAIIDASKNVKSADTATYPTLTELSYVKGVTSAIQTQLDSKIEYWRTLPGTPTRSSNTVLTITDTANANLYDLKFNRGTVLKWDDTTVHMAMVVSATYSSNTVTITIIGDVLSGTATMSSFKYALEKAVIKEFAIAGTLATGSNLSRIWEADKPYRVFGADAYVNTAGTTNSTTFEIRKNATADSLFTTDISIASTALRGYGYTAIDNASLALNDICSLTINTVSTTAPIDCYVALFLFPTYNQYL